MISKDIGETIPNNNQHGVSVTLPTWESNVGYEEGEDWVVKKMTSGYPRFFIHSKIQKLMAAVDNKYGRTGEKCMIFPSYNVAKRCRKFLESNGGTARVLHLTSPRPKTELDKSNIVETRIGVVFFDPKYARLAKDYWQHSGECISSRMAEYLLQQLFDATETVSVTGDRKSAIQAQKIQQLSPSLKQFKRKDEDEEFDMHIDQKYGRVLDLKFADAAKVALRRRIITNVENVNRDSVELDLDTINKDKSKNKLFHEDDVYLFPTGMAALFQCHQALLSTNPGKSVCFGFPYVDTLNILKKFGPGVHFLGLGDDRSLDELEANLESGSWEIMSLFCECPSNPLLKTPNLRRIKQLSEKYRFAIVVDDTIGNFININTLPFADMVATSLTKIFSGDSDVMGGSIVLNKDSPLYSNLKHYFDESYEDLFWAKDALVMERNSRDFASRSVKVNENALAVVDFLQKCPLISKIYYPSVAESKIYYDDVKTENGGYGGLMSFLFHDPQDAICFFNAMDFHKGPSLGSNFTLACPYTILAHYQELDEVEKWDIDRNLIRVSIGMEDPEELLSVMQTSLDVVMERRATR